MFKAKLKTNSSSAFTIVELVIVIAIIAILTAIGFVSYQGLTKRAKNAAAVATVDNVKKQLELHRAQYGVYPETTDCDQPVDASNICFGIDEDNYDFWYEGYGADGYNFELFYDDEVWVIDEITHDIIQLTSGWKQISAGSSHTCGLTTTGQVYCWGSNSYGQLGTGDTNDTPMPTKIKQGEIPEGAIIYQIVAGSAHTCGLTTDNKAYCWGSNSYGKLGDNTTVNKSTPTLVKGNHNFKQITLGSNHTCALTTNNQAYCWGRNNYGQLGDDSDTLANSSKPQAVDGSFNFKQITLGSNHTCALTTNNQAYCWGYDGAGQLGSGLLLGHWRTPMMVAGGGFDKVKVQQLSAGNNHTCALTVNNQAYCWGNNMSGQLGNEDTSGYIPTPTEITTGDFNTAKIQQITAGNYHSCGLTTTGQAYCWGENDYGQLGAENSPNTTNPVTVDGNHNFKQITTTASHTCGLTTDSEVYCWGRNTDGQLGNGETGGIKSTPTPVASPF